MTTNEQTIRIACRLCRGSGRVRRWGTTSWHDVGACHVCDGTGVAAERIVPACGEPFPLARPEDD